MAPTKTVTIEGKEWPVELDTNDLIEVEEITGLNILTGHASIARPSFTLLRALLHVALRKAGAKYSMSEAGKVITIENAAAFRQAFMLAWSGLDIEEEVDPEPDSPAA